MRRYMEELHAVSRTRDETECPLMMWGVIDSPALPTDFFEHGAVWIAKAAAVRILEDWKNHPDSAKISEMDSVLAEARQKLEKYAEVQFPSM